MRLPAVSVSVLLLAAAVAQDTVPRHALSGVTPIHTAPADPVGGAYGTWAAGDHYKASFHAGMTFVPYLGRSYPVTRQVTWTTEAATLGGADLLGAAASRHAHGERRYEYHFAGIVEAYDVRADGLEQTFVIAERGSGELRIAGRFGGNLRPIAAGDGVVFADEAGRELVRYGGPVAYDARGTRFAVASELDEDRLVLRVAAADVAAATFPLVIDPLLATNTVGTHPDADPDSVDVARDDDTNDLAICYLRHVSAVDQDAWVRQFRDEFTNAPAGDLVFTDINTWGIQNIRIANVGPADDFVAVINRALPTVYLRYWVQPTASLALNTTVSYAANPGADNQWYADIGGIEAYAQTGVAATGTSAMVVYMLDDSAAATPTDATTIWAQRLDVAGAGVVMGPQFQISSAGNDHDFPSITKVSEGQVGAVPPRWIATWQRYDAVDPNTRDWDVVGTQVFGDDTSAGLFEATGSAANDTHRFGCKVEGQRGRFLVAYAALPRAGVAKGAALQGKSMVAQRFDWPVVGAITTQPARTFRGPMALQQLIVADVAYDADTDSHWAVMDLDTVDGYLRVHRLGYTGGLLNETHVSGVPVGATHNGLGGIGYDDDQNRFVLAYGLPLDPPLNPVYGQYLTFAAEVAPSNMGPTCRPILPQWEGRDQNGALVPANDQQIGNQFGHVRVTGTPAGAVHFLVLSTNAAFAPIVHPSVGGGCMQLVSTGAGYLGILPVQVGADVAWNFPLPEALAPFTLRAQDVFLDPGDGKFYTSYRLDVPLVK